MSTHFANMNALASLAEQPNIEKAISATCSLDRLNAACAPVAHVIAAGAPAEWLSTFTPARRGTLEQSNKGDENV